MIERAAILAEGERSGDIVEWISATRVRRRSWSPQPQRGLHGTGFGGAPTARRGPARYVLPAGALSPD